MDFQNVIKRVVVTVLLLDVFFFLVFVRPFFQELLGPHAVDALVDKSSSLLVVTALSVWIVGWLILMTDSTAYQNGDASTGNDTLNWGLVNIGGAIVGILMIASLT